VTPKTSEKWNTATKDRSTQAVFNIASLVDMTGAAARKLIEACPVLANLPCLLAQFLYHVHVEPAGGHSQGRPPPTSGTSAAEIKRVKKFLTRHCIPLDGFGRGGYSKDISANIKVYRTVEVHMPSISAKPLVLRSCVFPGRLFHGHDVKPKYIMYVAYKDWHSGCTVAKEKMDFVCTPQHWQYIRYAKLVGTFTCNTLINPNDENSHEKDLLLALVEEYEVFQSPTTEPWKGATQLIKLEQNARQGVGAREPEMRVIGAERILGTVLLLPNLKNPTVPFGASVTGVARGVRQDSLQGAADGSTLWLVHNAEWQARRSFLKGGQERVPI